MGKRLTWTRRRIISGLAALTLALGSVVALESQLPVEPAEANTPAVACTGATNANSVEVTPSHGKAFYIDTGQGQRINAAYIGYRVKNTKSTGITDLWVKLDGFEDDIIQLAHPNDSAYQIGAVSPGSTLPSYFLLRADKPTSNSQTHNVRVYDGNPSLAGSTELYSCSYTFTRVRETIKAAANKVRSVTSTAIEQIGSNLVVSHFGETGLIGSGSAPDGSVVWISPASNSSWPTRAFKLVSVNVDYYTNKSATGQIAQSRTNELILLNASTVNGTNPSQRLGSYRATYTFKVIGRGAATVAPVAQISSGTQIKHTDMGFYYNSDGTAKNAPISSNTATVNLKASKNLKPFADTLDAIRAVGANVEIDYQVELENLDPANAVTVDTVVDTASEALSYKAGSLSADAISSSNVRTTFTTITSPVGSASSAGVKKWTFGGQITVPAGGKLQINYTMVAPCNGETITLQNRAVANIGDLVIGSSGTTVSLVEATLTTSSAEGDCAISNVSAKTEDENLGVEVLTGPATNLATRLVDDNPISSATLTGQVDSNGTAGSLIQCELSTESNLAGSTTVNTTVPANSLTTASADPIQVSCDVTNLLAGYTYYYRILVGPNVGQILSFTTAPPVAAAPTASTNSPSNFSQSGSGGNATFNVTLNSTVNALGNVTRVRYELATTTNVANCSGLGASTFYTLLDLDETDSPVNLVLSGGYATQVEFGLTGLSNAARCYRVLADHPFDAGGPTTTTLAGTSTVTGAWVGFTPSATNPPLAETGAASSVTANSATLNGTVTAGGATASNFFCITATAPTAGTGTLANCIGGNVAANPTSLNSNSSGSISFSASGLTAGTRYWFQAIATAGTQSSIGGIETFITPGRPIAQTNPASNLLATSATVNGTVSANGSTTSVVFCLLPTSDSAGKALEANGVMAHCWDGSALRNTQAPTVLADLSPSQTASRSANVSGLTAETSYSYQVIASNSGGIAAGDLEVFTTPAASVPPSVVTQAATNVASASAKINGQITAGNAPTASKFCWGTDTLLAGCTLVSANPATVSGNVGTAISSTVSGLTPGVTYYFRAIGNNGTGGDGNNDVFGEILSFTTLAAEVPTIVAENVTLLYGEDVAAYLANDWAPQARRSDNSAATGTFTNNVDNAEPAAKYPVGGYTINVNFNSTSPGVESSATTRTLTIIQRPLVIAVNSYSKLRTQSDPAFVPFIDSGTFAPGESVTNIGGINATRASGTAVGNYLITPASGINNLNYRKSFVPGTLYISDLQVDGTDNGQTFEVSKDVVCSCENLKEGTTATVTLTTTVTSSRLSFSTAGGFYIFGVFSTVNFFSTDFTITSTLTDDATVAEDGTCPLLEIKDVTQGSYDLEISGVSPNDDPLTQNLQINVINPTTNNDDGTGGGNQNQDPGPTPTPTPTPTPSPTAPAPQPTVTPTPAGPPTAVPTPTPTQAPTPQPPIAGPTPVPTETQASAPLGPNRPVGDGLLSWLGAPASGGTNGSNGSSNTAVRFDTGGEVRLTENGSVDLSSVRKVSPDQLANESIGGFAPGTGITLEVLGPRTGARFVVTSANALDAVTLIEAIKNSIPAQAADFFSLTNVRISSTPSKPSDWSDEQRLVADDYFSASGLARPISLAELDFSKFTKWIEVSSQGASYVPGSTVFLTLTSTPLVIAEGTVDRFGNLELTGSIPIEFLEAGEHRVRLVGIRSLGGVAVDENGEIVISPETLEEIRRFDLGTQATVRLGGLTPEGDYLNAIRVVPLQPIAPWWTLWFILAGLIITVAARRRHYTDTRLKLGLAAALSLVSALPAVIIGWLSTVTLVTWVGLALGLVAMVATVVIQPSDKVVQAR